MAGRAVWSGWRRSPSLSTAAQRFSLSSVIICLLLPPSDRTAITSGPVARVPLSSLPTYWLHFSASSFKKFHASLNSLPVLASDSARCCHHRDPSAPPPRRCSNFLQTPLSPGKNDTDLSTPPIYAAGIEWTRDLKPKPLSLMGVRTNNSWKLQADMELIGKSNMHTNPVNWSARGIGCSATFSNL